MGNTQTIMVGKGLSVFEGVEDREFDEWGEPVGYYVLWGNYQDFAGMDSEQHKGLERMYSLVRTVPIPKRLFFEENAEKTVHRKILYFWNTNMQRALRTSKFK